MREQLLGKPRGAILARVAVFEPVPVLGTELFEEVPGRRRGCSHQAASL
jgi:hypothetical protein